MKISAYLQKVKSYCNVLSTVLIGKTRLSISQPAPCEVLIIDSAAELELVPALLSNYRWLALDYRFSNYGGVLYIHPKIVIRTLAYLLHGYPPLASYMLAVISVTKPKVVIDFCNLDYMVVLASVFTDITFLSIINGMFNYPFNHELYKPMLHQILGEKKLRGNGNYGVYCFGQRDVDIFGYFGVSESNMGIRVQPVGPLLGSYYIDKIEPADCSPQIEFDICLISQSGVGHVTIDNPFNQALMKCNDLLCEFLVKFINTHGLRLVIAPRTREKGRDVEIEYNYFRKWFGGDVIIPHREDLMSTYRVMRRSRINISLCSTCGWEALLWKQKAMFCPFYLSEIFGEYAPGKLNSNQEMWEWWLEEANYEKFEIMLLELFNLTEDQYWDRAQHKAEYAMNYGASLATHILGEDIKSVIGR